MDLKNQAKGFWSSNGGTVLSVTSVLLSLAATGSAVISTSKAIEDIKEAEQKKYEDYISKGPKDDSSYEGLTKMEIVKACWKRYIVTGICQAGSIACAVGAGIHNKNAVNNAIMSSQIPLAYMKIFEEKVAQEISSEKLSKIRSEAAAEVIRKDPPKKQLVISDNDDIAWFKDDFSKRYFKCNTVTLERVKNEINNIMLNEGFVSLNEYYIKLDLDPIELGWDIGWVATIPGELMNFHIDYTALENGTPCGLIIFSPPPGPRKGTYV